MTVAALHLENHLPATLTAPGLSEAEFLALTEDFPDCFLEYTAEGTVLIMPPTDPDIKCASERSRVSIDGVERAPRTRYRDLVRMVDSSSPMDRGDLRMRPGSIPDRWQKVADGRERSSHVSPRSSSSKCAPRSSAPVAAAGKDGRVHRQRSAARLADRSHRSAIRHDLPARPGAGVAEPARRASQAKDLSRASCWILRES